nr:uncharacterized protein LOC121118274 isoform X2 [Lepeophtheirus salmonis]
MNNPYTIPQIYMPNRTSSHVQQDCPSRFQSLSWNSLPNISSQRNHRFPSLDESQRNHRFPSLDESQISVQHPPCLPNIGSPPRKLPKRGNPYTIGSNSSLQFQPNFSSSFESDSPPTNYSGSGNTPNRAFRGGEQSPDRQMHNSHPPIMPNDMSPSPLMSSANSSRSPSPSVPILPCQQPPCPSLCFPTYDSHCNTELYNSYDKELAEIRVREEELCKLEEEKRKEAEELNRQVEEVKRQELQIKKKELEIIKKRDDERRREELRRLDCLKEEETRKLEREFEYRQKCLREEHELELELLRRKEKEMVAFEIARFKDPIDELCEITKIDRTFESIEAEFKECNHLNPENEDICRLREEHSETVSNLDAAHNDRCYGGTQQQPVIRSPSPKKKKLFPSLKKKMELPLKKMELPLKKMELPLKKIKMFEPHFEKNRKVESPVEKFTKVYLPPCAKGKIIIKHEATVCNGGDCCTYSGPSCTLIPNSTIVDRNNKTEYNRETGISYNSSGNNELTRSREVSPYISNDDDDDYESSICEKLCSQCQQDINRETDNHCCLEERRIHNDQERQCLKKFKRRKEAKINVANSSLNINTRRNSKSQSSRRGSPSRKLKLNFMDRRKKNITNIYLMMKKDI